MYTTNCTNHGYNISNEVQGAETRKKDVASRVLHNCPLGPGVAGPFLDPSTKARCPN